MNLLNEVCDKKKGTRAKLVLLSLYHIQHLGARYVHSILKAQGYPVELVFFKNMFLSDAEPATPVEIDLLVDIIEDRRADVVGISLGCSTFLQLASHITKRIHDQLRMPVLWGGVHPTVCPEQCIAVADAICVGEGEYPMLELMGGLSRGEEVSRIKNLWFRHDGSVIRNEIRNLVEDLDSLPFPDYANEGKYYIDGNSIAEGDPVHTHTWDYITTTSRGCPNRCAYCGNSTLHELYRGRGRYVRRRSAANVIEELAHAKQSISGVRTVAFLDDLFPTDAQWVEEFCTRYRAEIGLPFWCYFHPRTVNEKTVRLLRSAGLSYADMGVQSGSERVRNSVFFRPDSNQTVVEAVGILNRLRILPRLDFILDNPFETEADKQETLSLLLELSRPFELNLFSLINFPGTALTRRALNEGLITEQEVEDKKRKILDQWRVTLNSTRSKEELFWIALFLLTGRRFIPRRFIRFLANRPTIKSHPAALVILAVAVRYVQAGVRGVRLLFTGRLTRVVLQRNLRFLRRETSTRKPSALPLTNYEYPE